MMDAVSNDAAASLPLPRRAASPPRGSSRFPSSPGSAGVDAREALLLEGPEGWTEFSPFAEYDDREAATWLAAALDFGWRSQPAPLRDPCS